MVPGSSDPGIVRLATGRIEDMWEIRRRISGAIMTVNESGILIGGPGNVFDRGTQVIGFARPESVYEIDVVWSDAMENPASVVGSMAVVSEHGRFFTVGWIVDEMVKTAS